MRQKFLYLFVVKLNLIIAKLEVFIEKVGFFRVINPTFYIKKSDFWG